MQQPPEIYRPPLGIRTIGSICAIGGGFNEFRMPDNLLQTMYADL